MDDREELRRLIDLIEKGSGTASLEQAVDDLKTFANTASFLANKLETRLQRKQLKSKIKGNASRPKAPRLPPPTRFRPPKQNQASTPLASPSMNAISTGISQADYDRVKPQVPQSPIGPSYE